jgi:cellulose synthase/poly-beta-1,6-N-acetylglucosamine synthase-like glycosyltransferase
VVIPVRDAVATLGRTLDALSRQTLAPREVIVVVDGSTDGSAALARAHPAVTRVLLLSGGSSGPGAARNAGAAAATGAVLAFTDADCVPAPDWLAAGMTALDRYDVVQGAVEPRGPVGPFDRTVRVAAPRGLFQTANLFVRASAFSSLRGFEPWLMPRDGKELGEDVWLGWRAVRAGLRVDFSADAVVAHEVFPRTARAAAAEQARLQHFPEMVARIPELRSALCWRRAFLSSRTAAFDFAAAGLAAAAASRRPALAAAALPYAALLVRERSPRVAAGRAAADAVSFAALARGSVRARSFLL